MVWFSALVVSIQSFVSGFAIGSLNSCLKEVAPGSILNDLPMSNFEQQVATGISTATALVASLLMSYPVKAYGSRPNIIFGAIITVIAGVLCALASSGYGFLVAGRAVLGWGVGLNSMTAPVLLSEIAPDSIRGTITALHQLMITLGILFAAVISYGFVDNLEHGWKYVLVMPAVFGLINLILYRYIPESPFWLIRASKEEEAHDIISNLNCSNIDENAMNINGRSSAVDAKMNEIRSEIESEAKLEQANWLDVFKSGRIFWIGIGLQFFQPFSGINAIMFYSTKIFGFAGVEQDIIATMLVAALNVLMTILCMKFVEKVGRKSLLVIGTAICAISLGGLGPVLLYLNDSPSAQGIISVSLVLTYVAGFAIGLGAVGWVIMAEITPARIRSKSYSVFISENWSLNLIIALFSLSVIEALGGGDSDAQQKRGVAFLFLIFSAVCVVGTIFALFVIPETKGLTASQIADIFRGEKDIDVTTKDLEQQAGIAPEYDSKSPLISSLDAS